MLEDATGLSQRRSVKARCNPLWTDHNQLTGFYLADVSCSDQIESTSLGSEHDGILFLARERGNHSHRQRPESARIARRENAVRADHYQRKRAFHTSERVSHGFRKRLLFRQRDQMNDDFGITVGLKDRSLALQPAADLVRIHQISVVRQRHHAFVRLHHDGLGIQKSRVARCRISRMSDSQRSVQFRELFFIENVHDQSHGLMHVQRHAVGCNDAGRFLSAMLQRMQAQIGKLLGFGVGINGDHAALFAKFIERSHEVLTLFLSRKTS